MAEPTYGAPTPTEPGNIDAPTEINAESAGAIAAPTSINADSAGAIAAPGTLTTLPAQGLSPLEDLTPPEE